jgi:hypothetical protein
MIPRIETVKANKQKKEDGYTLITDANAKVVFSTEDGQVEAFKVNAVNTLIWGVFHSPSYLLWDGMDSARKMEWTVFVTDTRIVFWSSNISTLTGAIKTVAGKATAGHFCYRDINAVSYGLSSFEVGRALMDEKNDQKEKTERAASGVITLSIVKGADDSDYGQTAATIEGDALVLADLLRTIADRAKKFSASNSQWDKAISIFSTIDLENDSGEIVINPELDDHALIERWYYANLAMPVERGNTATDIDETASAEKQPCAYCGEIIDVSSGFCSMCGKQDPFTGAGQEGNVFCTNCGSQLTEGVKFCGKCGAPTGYSASAATNYSPQTIPVATHPKKTTKLIIERRKNPRAILDVASNHKWDVIVDGNCVDSLYRSGTRVTIERDSGFICFVRCVNNIDEETNELRIPVTAGQTKQVAIIYKQKPLGVFGALTGLDGMTMWTLQTVPW